MSSVEKGANNGIKVASQAMAQAVKKEAMEGVQEVIHEITEASKEATRENTKLMMRVIKKVKEVEQRAELNATELGFAQLYCDNDEEDLWGLEAEK